MCMLWVVVNDDGFSLFVSNESVHGEAGKEVSLEVAKKIAMVCNVDYNFVAYPNVSEAKKFVESLLK